MAATALKLAPRVEIAPERPVDAAAADRLAARAFGPGRYAKVSYRVRERARFRPDLSFMAWVDGEPVGTVRLWSIRIGEAPAVFLGPIAVDAEHRGRGLGGRLIAAAVSAADAAGDTAVLLVGDPPFFGPHGFARADGVTLPGPVDAARVLIRASGSAPRGPVGR